MADKEKVVAIVGPTAIGKTALSIALAKELHTEIISGDSMLVYRGMDVGTAKPSLQERQGVRHHLIDILEPAQEFNVTIFKALAAKEITRLNESGKLPILAGGTGLYVKSLLENYHFNTSGGDAAYRQSLEQIAKEKGRAYVHAMLAKENPAAAARLHVNDFRRVIRALEVQRYGGEAISQESALKKSGELSYDAYVVGLTMERGRLYERINRRVERMIESGLVQEVQSLLTNGVPRSCQAMQGIGYKEIACYLAGEISLAQAIEAIQKATRHFAKRQLTWYRKMPYIRWFSLDHEDFSSIMGKIYIDLAGES